MAPPAVSDSTKKSEKTNLLDTLNPWGNSRNSSPARGPEAALSSTTAVPPKTMTVLPDHSTSSYYGRSSRQYPADCPPLKVQWFHAVDSPKRQGHWMNGKTFTKSTSTKPDAPPPAPKKYIAFSTNDSRSIETAYQKTLEDVEDGRTSRSKTRVESATGRETAASGDLGEPAPERKGEPEPPKKGVKVPVNEDFLFDVDIEERELAPVYWLGPVYDVRRGSWFYQEGSNLRPCEENLAAQLEEGYLKAKPWLYPIPEKNSASDIMPKRSSENLKVAAASLAASKGEGATTGTGMKTLNPPAPAHQPETHRLFGQYMNHVATFQDATTAWLSTDGMLSWVASSMYERFSGGAYMSGVKVVRGYSETKRTVKDGKRSGTPTGAKLSVDDAEEKRLRALKRRSAPPSTRADSSGPESREGRPSAKNRKGNEDTSVHQERPSTRFQRQLSSLMGSTENLDPDAEAEEIRKREEQEIRDDYHTESGEKQGREIEHLVLITHGIGQLLGLRVESLNFIHDVNVFRKTLKSVYSTSPGLRALNSELPEGPGNCRIQVLPVCWRHLLDFPRRADAKKREQDLGDVKEEEDEYPSLQDITVDGMAFARSLISDLALDVLLYQSAYREQILEIVLKEANRIYHLFRERNPEFKGTIHVIGHSLGSAIMFDILCAQKDKLTPEETQAQRNPLRIWPSSPETKSCGSTETGVPDLGFDFDVEDFYCLGSPVGLFQMLKGRTIAARQLVKKTPVDNQLDLQYVEDTFLSAPATNATDQRISQITGLPFSVSSPKAAQLYNIFHPSDPIGYRLEPLIAPAMASLKPQPLPYTKKGLFGSVAPQGLTGIGAKVGQSVSGLWSSFSAGIASNLLNRSLGLSQEDVAKLEQQQQQLGQASTVAGKGKAESEGDASSVVMDEELETLFSHFEKTRDVLSKEDGKTDGKSQRDRQAEEAKAQKLRREEGKVRALNRNGRVDYNIQEGVLDFNPINTIASHLSYWSDEDVSHFIISQILSDRSKLSKKK